MRTFLVKYYIIPGYFRQTELSGNNYNEIKKQFLTISGLKPSNILNITYSY